MVAFILICRAFGIPTNLEVFRNIFDIKPGKEGPRLHIFQKKKKCRWKIHSEVATICSWLEEWILFLSDGQQVSSISWNKRRALPNYELSSKQEFIEKIWID